MPDGDRQHDSPTPTARGSRARAPTTPITQPEHAADQRGDDRLVADHLAHLAARGADRAHHPQLAGALVDREDQRVDDPEQRDDHRQREQHVDQRQQRVDLVGLVLLELRRGARLGLREARSRAACSPRAAPARCSRRGRRTTKSSASSRCPNAARASGRAIVRLPSRRALSVAMPRTVSATRRSEGVSTEMRLPDLQVVGVRRSPWSGPCRVSPRPAASRPSPASIRSGRPARTCSGRPR